LKPIRHPFSWWRKPKQPPVSDLGSNPFYRPGNIVGQNGQSTSRIWTGERGAGSYPQSGITALPDGRTIAPTGRTVRNQNAFSQNRTLTRANVQTATRTWNGERGDKSFSWNRSAALPLPNAITRTGSLQPESLQRDVNTIRPKRETTGPEPQTLDDVLKAGGGGPHSFNEFLRNRTSTRPPEGVADRIRSQSMSQAGHTIRRLPSFQGVQQQTQRR